jgi:hypothetical protein
MNYPVALMMSEIEELAARHCGQGRRRGSSAAARTPAGAHGQTHFGAAADFPSDGKWPRRGRLACDALDTMRTPKGIVTLTSWELASG